MNLWSGVWFPMMPMFCESLWQSDWPSLHSDMFSSQNAGTSTNLANAKASVLFFLAQLTALGMGHRGN